MDTPPSPIRVNLLIVAAFAMLTTCLFLTLFEQLDDEFARSAVMLVLGRMLGYVDNIYSFEFGTTRASARKDDTIKQLTQTASTIATTAQVAAVSGGSGTSAIKVDEVQIDATGGSVNINDDKGSAK